MSRSLNKVTLIGNLGKDPEVRTTSNGSKVASFSVATSRVWNDQSGSKQEKTEWHRCVAWNTNYTKLADVVEQFTEALGLTMYTLYVQDYGAPVGYRLAVRHPERVTALVVQK